MMETRQKKDENDNAMIGSSQYVRPSRFERAKNPEFSLCREFYVTDVSKTSRHKQNRYFH